jgi:hypothetical protein
MGTSHEHSDAMITGRMGGWYHNYNCSVLSMPTGLSGHDLTLAGQ